MWNIRRGARTILLAVACLAACGELSRTATPAGATPILLAEFTWSQPDPVTLPDFYTIFTRRFGDELTGGWSETITQYGSTWAPPVKVAAINVVMTLTTDRSIGITPYNGGQSPDLGYGCATCYVHRLIGDEREEWLQLATEKGWAASLYVPVKLTHFSPLWGYEFTDIERVVTPQAQTIRLYGISIPEPTAGLLLLLGVVHVSTRFRVSGKKPRHR